MKSQSLLNIVESHKNAALRACDSSDGLSDEWNQGVLAGIECLLEEIRAALAIERANKQSNRKRQ